jgi:hypothetical protein
VHIRVGHDGVCPSGELLLSRQLAVDEEEGDLEKGRFLCELLNGVPAIAQQPVLAVGEGDCALAHGRVGEADVEQLELRCAGGAQQVVSMNRAAACWQAEAASAPGESDTSPMRNPATQACIARVLRSYT